MVIGCGLIANGVSKISIEFPNVIFFASGVSDSNEQDDSKFLREKLLLEKTIIESDAKQIIYFSTYSVLDDTRKNDKYIIHKKEMERLVENTNNYLIIRLTNVIGKIGNKNNLIRFFIDKISIGEKVIVWKNVKRNIVGIDDLVNVIAIILNKDIKNQSILLAHPFSYNINEIVNHISFFLNKEALIDEIEKGVFDEFQCEELVLTAFNSLESVSKEKYIPSLLQKYYS